MRTPLTPYVCRLSLIVFALLAGCSTFSKLSSQFSTQLPPVVPKALPATQRQCFLLDKPITYQSGVLYIDSIVPAGYYMSTGFDRYGVFYDWQGKHDAYSRNVDGIYFTTLQNKPIAYGYRYSVGVIPRQVEIYSYQSSALPASVFQARDQGGCQ